ncbi:MAG: PIG-L family deacetylase [Chloroflexota bacterium]
MHWVYLSPHLDDVVLSCGGLVWQQTAAGDTVEIITVCAGDPPPPPYSVFADELHQRWAAAAPAGELAPGEPAAGAVAGRRAEDLAACAALAARPVHWDIPDCIYRTAPGSPTGFLYADRDAIFAAWDPAEQPLADQLARRLRAAVPPAARLVCPLGIGSHVDHQLVRRAAEQSAVAPLYYYADYPYAAEADQPDAGSSSVAGSYSAAGPSSAAGLLAAAGEALVFPIDPLALQGWQQAAAAYRSQISTFWADEVDLRRSLHEYCRRSVGVRLWHAGV